VLDSGKKVFDGITLEAVEVYKRIRTEAMGDTDLKGKVLKLAPDRSTLAHDVVLEGFRLTERDDDGDSFGVVNAQLAVRRDIEHISINFGISNHHGIVVCAWDGARAGKIVRQLKAGDKRNVEMTFSKRLLPGRYFVSCIIHELIGDVTKPQSIYQNFLSFEIGGSDVMSGIADLGMNIEMPG
jgi:hypothetical protein